MHPFWKSKLGKLVIGNCGTQFGMISALSGLVAISLLCLVCASANMLSFGLTQRVVKLVEVAATPTSTPVEVSSSHDDEEVSGLIDEVDSLLAEVEALEANTPAPPPLPTASPTALPPKPVAMANQSGVDLHGGPGTNYERIGVLPVGESWSIVGRNINSTWWVVATPNGLVGWVADRLVATFDLNDSIPIVVASSDLAQLASSSLSSAATPPVTPTVTATPTPMLPPGTPTPGADEIRQYVEDTSSYQKVRYYLLVPPVSISFSPDGSQFAMTERIKLYTVMTDGAYTDIWFEDDDTQGPLNNIVWSPDGKYIAFVSGFKDPKCKPCRSVALLRRSDGQITFLEAPDDQETDAPRWTQDGRLLVNVHSGEPADGVAYVYNIFGDGREAKGVYVLSSSHEGQKWYPWRPGRIWRAGVSERADSYNSD
jgi:hypothetical protein